MDWKWCAKGPRLMNPIISIMLHVWNCGRLDGTGKCQDILCMLRGTVADGWMKEPVPPFEQLWLIQVGVSWPKEIEKSMWKRS